jgi:hypothetical protein
LQNAVHLFDVWIVAAIRPSHQEKKTKRSEHFAIGNARGHVSWVQLAPRAKDAACDERWTLPRVGMEMNKN